MCEVFRKKKNVFRPPSRLTQQRPVIVRRDIEAMLSPTELCYRPYVIVHRAMLSSTELCYRPQSYVIIHRAMLQFTELCYRPYVIIHRAMLLSTELCYRPQSYVILHMLLSTELCYCPKSYVIVHRAMLLSMCYLFNYKNCHAPPIDPYGCANVHNKVD